MLKSAVIITVSIGAAIGFFAYHIGFFDSVKINREQCGPFNLIYREHRGTYKAVRLIIKEVYRYTNDTMHLKTEAGFAVFFDDPQSDADTLRSIEGVIADSLPSSVSPQYKTGVFRRTEAFVGRFPLRGFFSYAIGGYKFYESLHRFRTEKKINRSGPVMEIYEPARRLILYIYPMEPTAFPTQRF